MKCRSKQQTSFHRVCLALLVKNPTNRLGCGEKGPAEIMEHPWFSGLDWNALLAKQIEPPFKPQVAKSADTRYVPQLFKQQDVADSPVGHSLGSSGPGRQTMHFEDFSYMGSDIMGSRRTSLFRESDLRMEIEDDKGKPMSLDDPRQPWG